MIDSKPSATRASWDANGKLCWYIGHSPDHYRCMCCYLPQTRSEVHSDTIIFFPKQVPFPSITTDDFIWQATSDIITLLTHPPPSSTVPSLELGDSTKNALLQVATILNWNPLNDTVMEQQHCVTTAAAAALSHQSLSLPTPSNSSPFLVTKPASSISKNFPSSSSLSLDQFARVLKQRQSPQRPPPQKYPSPLSSFKSQAARFFFLPSIFFNHHHQ